MPFLWNGDQITNQDKPSPTNQVTFPDSARNSEIFRNGRKRPSCLFRFMEGASLPISGSEGGRRRRWRPDILWKGQAEAGMTVEASLLLPLFLFFFMNMGCTLEMVRLHGNLQFSLWQLGSRMALYGYVVYSGEEPGEGAQEPAWWEDAAGMVFASTFVKTGLIDHTGRDYLEHSPLKKGADSLQLWESEIFGPEDRIDIVVTYAVSPWNSMGGFFTFRMANRYYGHIWNGYRLPAEGEAERTVYVTENASVYHADGNCSYLQLSIRQIPGSEVGQRRNSYGSSYQPCKKCAGERALTCYVTDQGGSFHSRPDCPGLKRTVYLWQLGEEEGIRPCSRCGYREVSSKCKGGEKDEGVEDGA